MGTWRDCQRFLRSRLAFALTVRSAGFNAAAATAVEACGVFLPVRALAAIRIASVWAATIPDAAAAAFSETIRFNSALSLDGIPAAMRIGHRHHSVMLVSITAAPRSIANSNGVCRFAICVKLSRGMFVPYIVDAGGFSLPSVAALKYAPAVPKKFGQLHRNRSLAEAARRAVSGGRHASGPAIPLTR